MNRLLIATLVVLGTACTVETEDLRPTDGDTAAGADEANDDERKPLGKADRIGSCQPSDCGGISSEGTCWCDDLCVVFGDCCSDKIDVCEAETCEPIECGPKPLFLELCSDGSTAGVGDCVSDEAGECGWEITECPEPEPGEGPCTDLECGPSPLVLDCDGNISHAADCERDDEGFCGWVIDECEDETCAPEDCGPKPEIAKLCDDGTAVGADLCMEVEEGNCGWTFPECPAPEPGEGPCGIGECGGFPPLVVDCDGNVSHNADCLRDDDGFCNWAAPACEA